MAKDGLFFRSTSRLNDKGVPGTALVYQGIWIVILIMLRTRKPDGTYGNLYNDLLDYVVFAALLFYVLTILGCVRVAADQTKRGPAVPSIWVSVATALVYSGRCRNHGGAAAVQDADVRSGDGDCAIGASGVLVVEPEEERGQQRTVVSANQKRKKEELHGQPLVCEEDAGPVDR